MRSVTVSTREWEDSFRQDQLEEHAKAIEWLLMNQALVVVDGRKRLVHYLFLPDAKHAGKLRCRSGWGRLVVYAAPLFRRWLRARPRRLRVGKIFVGAACVLP